MLSLTATACARGICRLRGEMRIAATTLAVLALLVIAPASAHARTRRRSMPPTPRRPPRTPVSSPASSTESHEADATSSPTGSATAVPPCSTRRRRTATTRSPSASSSACSTTWSPTPSPASRLWFVPIVDPDGYDGAPSGVAFDRNWPDHWGFDNEGSQPPPTTRPARRVRARGRRARRADRRRAPDPPARLAGGRRRPDRLPGELAGPDAGDRRARVRAALAGRDDAHSGDRRLLARPGRRAGDRQRHADRHRVSQVRHAGLRGAHPGHRRSSSRSTSRRATSRSTWRSATTTAGPDFVPHKFTRVLRPARRRSRSTRAARSAPSACTGASPAARSSSAPLSEYKGGERYGAPGAVYHRLRGQVTGFRAGDSVQVWFEGGGERSAAVHVHRRRERPERRARARR